MYSTGTRLSRPSGKFLGGDAGAAASRGAHSASHAALARDPSDAALRAFVGASTLHRSRTSSGVLTGVVGVLIILRPSSGVFSPWALLPLGAAVLFATYSVLTRLTTRGEPNFPSFFWPGVLGAGVMTVIGLGHWQPVLPFDWVLIAGYSALSVFSHWLLLKREERG